MSDLSNQHWIEPKCKLLYVSDFSFNCFKSTVAILYSDGLWTSKIGSSCSTFVLTVKQKMFIYFFKLHTKYCSRLFLNNKQFLMWRFTQLSSCSAFEYILLFCQLSSANEKSDPVGLPCTQCH